MAAVIDGKQAKQCLKWRHVRAPSDAGPDYECPKCGAVYAKVEAAARKEWETRNLAPPAPIKAIGAPSEAVGTNVAQTQVLTDCPDCGKRVSRRATVCPGCGSPLRATEGSARASNTSGSHSEPGSFASMAAGVVTLLIIGWAAFALFGPSKDSPEQVAIRGMKLAYDWKKVGFEANFLITNDSAQTVRDITVICEHSAPSGTKIDFNSTTIYESIAVGQTRHFLKVNMGFIDSQAKASTCRISRVRL